MNEYIYNIASIFSCLLLLLLYLLITYSLTIFYPFASFKSHLALSTTNSYLWVHKHKDKNDAASVTLAIQTFRNTILIAVFVGGSALNTAISQIESYPGLHTINARIRTIIISCLLFLSFLSWANVIRSASHLGYLTGVISHEYTRLQDTNAVAANNHETASNGVMVNSNDVPGRYIQLTEDELDSLMRQEETMITIMHFSFSLGFKFQFVAIPFFMYAAGPELLIISTVFILLFMYGWDTINKHGPMKIETKKMI